MRVVQATELIALDVFNSGARQITLCDVEHYLAQLRSHSPECRCGRCSAAAIVRPDRVLMIVRSWQKQVRTNQDTRTALNVASVALSPGNGHLSGPARVAENPR